MFIIFYLVGMLFFSYQTCGIKLCPPKITIDIIRYTGTPFSFKIQVENPSSTPVNVTISIENPPRESLTENYSYIPDLSWIKVDKKTKYIPPFSSTCFNLTLDIPNSEKALHYNEKWEVWAIVCQKRNANLESGVAFNIKLASKIFIHTPVEKVLLSQPFYMILFVAAGIILITLFYMGKKLLKNKLYIK